MASRDPRNPTIAQRLGARVSGSNVIRIFRYPDFRLLWFGAFLSFTGSWIQTIARGYFVYSMTKSESALAFVTFCSSVPVFFFGFIAGSLSDTFDKRKVLIIAQSLLGLAAFYMAAAIYFNFIQYWQIVVVALFIGVVGCIEMPTRQAIVSRVVPPEDLPMAVPINAMTFNVARIFGPAIGGLILAAVGVPFCYLADGISFIALIWAVKAIKADLRPRKAEPQPILDLIMEGFLYTFRDPRLKTLFLLETVTAAAGISYISLLPAYVEQVMGLHDEAAKGALASGYTFVGVGALTGLLLITHLAHSEKKGLIIRLAMWSIGLSMLILSVARSIWIVMPVLSIMGMATIAQFNTTNALFQILSPERLRGRVLAMHIWALNGLSPFGILFFGWLAQVSRTTHGVPFMGHTVRLGNTGVSLTFQVAGVCMLLGAAGAMFAKRGLSNLRPEPVLVA